MKELRESLDELYVEEQTSKEQFNLSLEQSIFINEQVIQEMILQRMNLYLLL